MVQINNQFIEWGCREMTADETFQQYARHFAADLLLRADEEEYPIRVDNGQAYLIGKEDISTSPIIIEGSKEQWSKIIAGQPGGIHRAFRHKTLLFKGNVKEALRGWKAIWYMGEIFSRYEGGE